MYFKKLPGALLVFVAQIWGFQKSTLQEDTTWVREYAKNQSLPWMNRITPDKQMVSHRSSLFLIPIFLRYCSDILEMYHHHLEGREKWYFFFLSLVMNDEYALLTTAQEKNNCHLES